MPGEAIGDGIADLLGIEPGMVVQTRNWGLGTACLDGVRAVLERHRGGELLDESADEIIDVVLLCWREGDGEGAGEGEDDLVDALMDAMGNLDDVGWIWLITPEAGHGGQLASDELAEAVPAAGLVRTGGHSLGDGWRAIRLTWPPWRRTWR